MGSDLLLKVKNRSNFKWINSNVFWKNDHPFSDRYIIKEIDGVRLCFFGLLTPSTFKYYHYSTKDLIVKDPIETAEEIIEELRDKVDIFIAITHQSYEKDLKLAQIPEIKLILGGHDHFPLSTVINDKLIIKSGSDFKYVSITDVTIEKSDKFKTFFSWKFVSTHGVDQDINILKKMNKMQEEMYQ